MRQPAVTAPAVAGLAMVAVGVAVYAFFSSLDVGDYAMMCTSGVGCVSRDPVLFTVHGAALQHVQPLLTAGTAIAGSALALAALRPAIRDRAETRRAALGPTLALWAVVLVLVGGGTAFSVWSNTPDVVNSTIRECSPGSGCSQTVVYTLQQFAAVAVPAALTAGLLVLGLAVVLTALRLRRREDDGVAVVSLPATDERTSAGADLTPFMPPTEDGDRDR
jgi:hypothetical protein